jgi:hypothetical protein
MCSIASHLIYVGFNAQIHSWLLLSHSPSSSIRSSKRHVLVSVSSPLKEPVSVQMHPDRCIRSSRKFHSWSNATLEFFWLEDFEMLMVWARPSRGWSCLPFWFKHHITTAQLVIYLYRFRSQLLVRGSRFYDDKLNPMKKLEPLIEVVTSPIIRLDPICLD